MIQVPSDEQNMHTCCVFELHSMYAGDPISFLSSSPFREKAISDQKVEKF